MVLERTKGPFTLSSVANLRFDAEYFFRSEKVLFLKNFVQMLIPQLTWEELFRCSHSALWVMTTMMGHSLEVYVLSVGFGASFHFTNDLYFFESWIFTSFSQCHHRSESAKTAACVFNSRKYSLFQQCHFSWSLCDTLRRSLSELVKLKDRSNSIF